MILAGRWAYKKYKKNKREKEEIAKGDHAKHEQLVDAGRDEVSKTPVPQLGVVPPHSDPPPRYSGPQDSNSFSLSSPQGEQQQQASWTPSTPLGKDLPSLPPPAPVVSPAVSPAVSSPHHPTEIAVHGKWVWVAEDAPTPGVADQKQQQQHVPAPGPIATGSVMELPAGNGPVELPVELPTTPHSEQDEEEKMFAELDGEPVHAALLEQGPGTGRI